MSSLLEQIADALARDVLRVAQELGDDDLVGEISKVVGTSSPTTQEAFNTAVRVRMAEGRARKALAERLGKSSWDEVVASRVPASEDVERAAPMTVAASAPQKVEHAPLPMAPARAAPVTTTPTAPSMPPVAAPADRVMGAGPMTRAASAAGNASAASPMPVPLLQEVPLPTPAEEQQPTPYEFLAAETSVEELVAQVLSPTGGPVARVDPVTRPEPVPEPPPVVVHPPGSLAEALAKAAAMPRPKVAPAEPKPPVHNPYSDIEMPDGDWG
jgi:hypothetical protein